MNKFSVSGIEEAYRKAEQEIQLSLVNSDIYKIGEDYTRSLIYAYLASVGFNEI